MAGRSGAPARAALSAVPVPAEPLLRDDGELIGGLRWDGSRTMRQGQRLRRRVFRRIRRLTGVVIALVVVVALVLAEVLLLTPGVTDAPALARALARAHGVAFPGLPVPQRVAAALIATDDHRFYSEPGIDPIAIASVIAGHLTGRTDQSSATLYQQLAKVLYTPGRNGAAAEGQDALLGIKLRFSYSHAEILQMYADVAYFGNRYYGLAAASCGYFGKSPSHLSWGQTAMLVGLLQAPSADNPLSHFANARAREASVLRRLVATGWLTQPQATDAYRQPLNLATGRAAGCAAPPGRTPEA